jgi:hypothetical protein
MSQTNVQVPIEQRNHDKQVLEERKILYGDERFKPVGDEIHPPGGPSSLGCDLTPEALVLHHGSATPGTPAPDMLYMEQTTNVGSTVAGMPGMGVFKQHMSGRRHAGTRYNAGRNVGSTHLQMPAEPHHEPEVQRAGTVSEGAITLPKDQ